MDIFKDDKSRRLYKVLSDAFTVPLPGAEAQVTMAPAAKLQQIFKQVQPTPVLSSIMLVLYYKSDELHLVYIKRPEYPGVHSGQIAFPGGRREAEDSDNQVTALRETEEEIGLSSDKIVVAGALTPLYIPPSNYLVYPFVGVTNPNPTFTPCPDEVASVVEIPVSELLQPECIKMMPPSNEFNFMEVPAFVVGNTVVWGATAMITAELVSLLKRKEVAIKLKSTAAVS